MEVFKSLSCYLFCPVCVLLLGEAKHMCRKFLWLLHIIKIVCSALDARLQDLQLSMCESWLIGEYYYKYIGSWESQRIFWKEYFVLMWFFNSYGQRFRALLALYVKILVRLSVLCHFDAHLRTMINVSAECRWNSRFSFWGTLFPLREQLKHVNTRFLQKINDRKWKFQAANFGMEGGF